MLENEFHWYLENQDALVSQYNGKVLVIKGQKVIGVYADKLQAFRATLQKEPAGTFLIQLCSPGDEAYTTQFIAPQYDTVGA